MLVFARQRAAFVLMGLLVACGSTSPVTRENSALAPAASSPELRPQMREHFGIAIWARDVVIAGELEPLREPLRELATLEYGAVVEVDQRRLAELQRLSAAAAKATTLHEAATEIARIAGVCGDCHREHGRGPLVTVEPETALEPGATVADRMSRHRLGADLLWRGLIGPSEQAYHQGARLIARMPEAPSDSRYVAAWREVEQLAALAAAARSRHARTQTYGELLARCGRCHAATGPLPLCFEGGAGDGSCRLAAQ